MLKEMNIHGVGHHGALVQPMVAFAPYLERRVAEEKNMLNCLNLQVTKRAREGD